MPTPIRVKEEMSALKSDADKMVRDISNLSAELTAAGIDHALTVSNEVSHYTQQKIAQLRLKIDEANKLMAAYGTKVNSSVRNNPYPFIGGSLGVGFVLGKFLRSRGQSSR